MNQQNIGIIALDLDGTLLDTQKCLSERNRAALCRAAELGIEIVPTTGRFYNAIPAVVRELPFLHYAITINGAQVQNIQTGDVLYRAEMRWQQAVELMEYLDTLPAFYDCYQENRGWMTAAMQSRVSEAVHDPLYLAMIRDLRAPVPELKAFLTERKLGVQKVQVYPGSGERRTALLRTLSNRFPHLIATSSIAENVEINAKDANKGRALLALAAHLGLNPEQTMSFGDGLNDLTMLRDAGVGVAMANGVAEAKAAAALVTVSNDEDGVAAVIERLILT